MGVEFFYGGESGDDFVVFFYGGGVVFYDVGVVYEIGDV